VGLRSGYWLPDVGQQVFHPSLVAAILLLPAAVWFEIKNRDAAESHWLSAIVIVCLYWIAFLGAFTFTGYSALDVAEALTDRANVVAARWIRIGIVVLSMSALVVVALRTKRSWPGAIRFLAVLGYLYTAAAMLRVTDHANPIIGAAGRELRESIGSSASADPSATVPKRQVVWLIMDELDFEETLGRTTDKALADPPMPNLDHLAHVGVSASNAYSPARDTIASIPALLTGYDLSKIRFDARGMTLITREFGERSFDESNSIFERLPSGPQSAAILGFYHPYCSLFPAVNPCISLPKDNVGRWFDPLTVFAQPLVASARWLPDATYIVPEFLYQLFEPMYRISADTLNVYPKFLALRDKSLIYIHVNLPHTPGDYSQRVYRVRDSGDDRTEYRRNLRIVDELIGQAVNILSARAKDQKILLIVSSDHWHRINSPTQPQRIPWIAWQVGEVQGESIPERISTLNTGLLIESFLAGELDSQVEVARWWEGKPVYPTLMPHGYSSYE
jgi:hypothetical protein